jgi:ubiquinone biosynthesis protein
VDLMWERKRRDPETRGSSWTGLLLAAVLGAAAVLGLQAWGQHRAMERFVQPTGPGLHFDGPPPLPEDWHRHP